MADFFWGVAKWVEDPLRMGRHVIVSDAEKRWVDAVAGDLRFPNAHSSGF